MLRELLPLEVSAGHLEKSNEGAGHGNETQFHLGFLHLSDEWTNERVRDRLPLEVGAGHLEKSNEGAGHGNETQLHGMPPFQDELVHGYGT
jgi:hypothetical protein